MKKKSNLSVTNIKEKKKKEREKMLVPKKRKVREDERRERKNNIRNPSVSRSYLFPTFLGALALDFFLSFSLHSSPSSFFLSSISLPIVGLLLPFLSLSL